MARTIGGAATAGGWTRRTYLVDRGFQLKYAIVMAVAAALVAAVLGLWLQQSHTQVLSGAGLDYAGRRAVESSDRILFTVFAGVAAMVAVGLGLVGVFMTHRVAGPAMIMRRYLASLAHGRYPRVRSLRKRDELSDLFVTVADAIERVRQRDVRQVELLEDALSVMRAAVEKAPELAQVIEALEREVAERRAAFEVSMPGVPPPAQA